VAEPTLIAQISDPHIRVGPRDREPAQALAAAVRALRSQPNRLTAVLVTGDLVDQPGAREYERVRELLEPLGLPIYVLAGNHDDRDAVREYFALDISTGRAGEPFRYAVRLGGVRLIACDTTVPGRMEGRLDLEHRAWLEAQLAAEPALPALVAMHHPPISTGIRAMDEIGLPPQDRAGLEELLPRYPQARRIVCGHAHRGAFGVLGGCGVVICPSTWRQLALEIPGDEIEVAEREPAWALHALVEGGLVSHLVPIYEGAEGRLTVPRPGSRARG